MSGDTTKEQKRAENSLQDLVRGSDVKIGRAPIVVPDKVEVKVDAASNAVEVKSGSKQMVIPMQPASLPRWRTVRF